MSVELGKKIIDTLGTHLLDYGFQIQKNEEEEQEVETLRCAFVLSSGYPMIVDINFYELADYSVLEYHAYVRGMIDEEMQKKIAPVLEEANTFAPVGHFGYHENDLFFRHGLAVEGEEVDPVVENAETTLELFISVLDMEVEKLGFMDEAEKEEQED